MTKTIKARFVINHIPTDTKYYLKTEEVEVVPGKSNHDTRADTLFILANKLNESPNKMLLVETSSCNQYLIGAHIIAQSLISVEIL